MIIREIKDDPDGVIANFDYWNDYPETLDWCKVNYPEIIPRLDEGFMSWLEKKTSAAIMGIPASIRDEEDEE